MTPIRYATSDSRLGTVLVAGTQVGLCAVFLGDEPAELVAELTRRFPRAELTQGDAVFQVLVAKVLGHIERPQTPTQLPLDIHGTAFQQCVWAALRQIPVGQTRTYAQVAAAMGQPTAVRAVARACGANPLALLVPCHRVVGADGSLTGYRWGVERKRLLLEWEAAK